MILSPAEAELLRLLAHARACDGIRCSLCDRIDSRLQDGLPHAGDDPTIRFSDVDAALATIGQHLEQFYQRIEGAPLPPGALRFLSQAIEWCDRTRQLLRLPVPKLQERREVKTVRTVRKAVVIVPRR